MAQIEMKVRGQMLAHPLFRGQDHPLSAYRTEHHVPTIAHLYAKGMLGEVERWEHGAANLRGETAKVAHAAVGVNGPIYIDLSSYQINLLSWSR